MSKVNLKLLGRYRKLNEVRDPDNLLDKDYFYNNFNSLEELKQDKGVKNITFSYTSSLTRIICFKCNTIGNPNIKYSRFDDYCPNCNNLAKNIYSDQDMLTSDIIRLESKVKDNIEHISIYGLYVDISEDEKVLTLREDIIAEISINLKTFVVDEGEFNIYANKILNSYIIFKLKVGEIIKPYYDIIEKAYREEDRWNKHYRSLKKQIFLFRHIIVNNIDVNKLVKYPLSMVENILTSMEFENNTFLNFKDFSTFESFMDNFKIEKIYTPVVIKILSNLNLNNNDYVRIFNNWKNQPKEYKDLLLQYSKNKSYYNLISLERDLFKFFNRLDQLSLSDLQKKYLINELYLIFPMYLDQAPYTLLLKLDQLIESKIEINEYTISEIGFNLISKLNKKNNDRFKIFLDIVNDDPLNALEFLSKRSIDTVTKKEYSEYILK